MGVVRWWIGGGRWWMCKGSKRLQIAYNLSFVNQLKLD